MKKTILRYGLYSALTLVVLFVIGLAIGQNLDYSTREVIGYATILISLLFVFFGIKHYRDHVNNGIVSFGKALLIGILISVIASLAFGLIDIIYAKYINPEFVTEYYDHMVEQYRSSLSATEFEEKLKEMESQKEMFSNRFISFLVMSATVFVIGFIISLISSLILQRKTA